MPPKEQQSLQTRARQAAVQENTSAYSHPLEQFVLNFLLDLKSARERILISKARISRKQCIWEYPYGVATRTDTSRTSFPGEFESRHKPAWKYRAAERWCP